MYLVYNGLKLYNGMRVDTDSGYGGDAYYCRKSGKHPLPVTNEHPIADGLPVPLTPTKEILPYNYIVN